MLTPVKVYGEWDTVPGYDNVWLGVLVGDVFWTMFIYYYVKVNPLSKSKSKVETILFICLYLFINTNLSEFIIFI